MRKAIHEGEELFGVDFYSTNVSCDDCYFNDAEHDRCTNKARVQGLADDPIHCGGERSRYASVIWVRREAYLLYKLTGELA